MVSKSTKGDKCTEKDNVIQTQCQNKGDAYIP